MRGPLRTLVLLVTVTGCSNATYEFALENDLPHVVVVAGCEGCRDGRLVEPGKTLQLRLGADAVLRLRKPDGTVLGCGTSPHEAGGSTSDLLSTQASVLVGSACP